MARPLVVIIANLFRRHLDKLTLIALVCLIYFVYVENKYAVKEYHPTIVDPNPVKPKIKTTASIKGVSKTLKNETLTSKEKLFDVSIVIVIRSKVYIFLRNCLHSLYHNIPTNINPDKLQILVVEHGAFEFGRRESINDIVNEYKEKHHNIELILSNGKQSNTPISLALNSGIAQSKNDLILFLSDDIEVLPNSIETMISTLNKNKSIGLIGGKLITGDHKIAHAGIDFKMGGKAPSFSFWSTSTNTDENNDSNSSASV